MRLLWRQRCSKARGGIFIKAYILKLVGAALLAAFSEYLTPKEWQKYIKLISGLVIITVMIHPFLSDAKISIFTESDSGEKYIAEAEDMVLKEVRRELEQRVAEDIEARVAEEFSQKLTARAQVRVSRDGKIESVGKIELSGKRRKDIEERLSFVYGTDEVIWHE